MNVKLVVLKSGEDVVAGLQEMIVKDSVVGYFLKYPCRVNLFGEKSDSNGNTNVPFQIQLTPWLPLSKDEVIPIPTDWVVTIVEPVDKLLDMYQKGVDAHEERKAKVAGSDEQSDAVNSD